MPTKTKKPRKQTAAAPAVRALTHTCLILDQSSSMADRRQLAVDTYNENVDQAVINSADQDITVSLLTFDSDVKDHLWCVPASQLEKSTEDGYRCCGSTALNDAVGYAIEKLLATTNHEDKNTSYLLQVVTDGEENQSRMYPRFDPDKKLQKLIEKVQATGRWTISFMGCDINYLEQLAKETAVPVANMAAFSVSNLTAASATASANAGKYYRARAVGQSCTKQMMNSTPGRAAVLCSLNADDAMADLQFQKTSGGLISAEALVDLQNAAKANVFTGKSVDWQAVRSDAKVQQ